MMRKEMPFDFRVVNITGDLFIHNKTIWNTRSLNVHYKIDGKNGSTTLDGTTNTAVIHEVKAAGTILLKITRKDLKGKLLYKTFVYEGKIPEPKKEYIVFIGASIGRDWKLEELYERQPSTRDIAILYWPEYKFNKKDIIDHVLKIPIKPKMVLLKECAAYFPRDEKKSIDEIADWFISLNKAGIKPVAMTTVPVTRIHDKLQIGRADSIYQYNNLIRQSKLDLLDLAIILGVKSDSGKFLIDKFANEDGLHLNSDAYFALDQALVEFLIR